MWTLRVTFAEAATAADLANACDGAGALPSHLVLSGDSVYAEWRFHTHRPALDAREFLTGSVPNVASVTLFDPSWEPA